MLSFAVGEFGLRLNQAREMCMKEYSLKAQAHSRMERNQWHRTRVMCAILLSPHRKKSQNINPQQLIPLPGDTVTNASTAEGFQRALKRFQKPKKILRVYN